MVLVTFLKNLRRKKCLLLKSQYRPRHISRLDLYKNMPVLTIYFQVKIAGKRPTIEILEEKSTPLGKITQSALSKKRFKIHQAQVVCPLYI